MIFSPPQSVSLKCVYIYPKLSSFPTTQYLPTFPFWGAAPPRLLVSFLRGFPLPLTRPSPESEYRVATINLLPGIVLSRCWDLFLSKDLLSTSHVPYCRAAR